MLTLTATHTPTPTVLYIYSDAAAPQIFIPSGYMGDGDLEVIENWTVEPYSGTSAIRIVYDPQGRPLDDGHHRCQMGLPTTNVCGWTGLYWLYPADNQGIVPGYDLSASGCTRMTFWARSETPLSIRFIVGGIGWGIPTQPAYPDSLRDPRSTGWVQLSSEWTMYTN